MISRVAILLISTILLGRTQSPDPAATTSSGISFWAVQHYKHILLANEVASELQLSSQQRNILRPIISRRNNSTSGFVVSGIKKDYNDIKAVLNPDQERRFEQLLLQRTGALHALLMPGIQSRLKLTSPQLESLRRVKELYSSGTKNLNEFEILYLGVEYSQGRFSGGLGKAADRMAESVLAAQQILEWRGLNGRLLDPKPRNW